MKQIVGGAVSLLLITALSAGPATAWRTAAEICVTGSVSGDVDGPGTVELGSLMLRLSAGVRLAGVPRMGYVRCAPCGARVS